MDIHVSSNFERLLFDLAGQDGTALAEQMKGFEANRAMRLTNAQRAGAVKLFSSARIDGDDMSIAMRWANDAAGQLIDPHTAVGLAAARLSDVDPAIRSEEHTYELQSLMRMSYAGFCLNKKMYKNIQH